jgi:hypothetical protein
LPSLVSGHPRTARLPPVLQRIRRRTCRSQDSILRRLTTPVPDPLPPDLRARYVQHLRALLPSGAPGLVLTFEYDQALMQGPPFSVSEAELRHHYSGAQIEMLAEVSTQLTRPDAPQVQERCFLLTL